MGKHPKDVEEGKSMGEWCSNMKPIFNNKKTIVEISR